MRARLEWNADPAAVGRPWSALYLCAYWRERRAGFPIQRAQATTAWQRLTETHFKLLHVESALLNQCHVQKKLKFDVFLLSNKNVLVTLAVWGWTKLLVSNWIWQLPFPLDVPLRKRLTLSVQLLCIFMFINVMLLVENLKKYKVYL